MKKILLVLALLVGLFTINTTAQTVVKQDNNEVYVGYTYSRIRPELEDVKLIARDPNRDGHGVSVSYTHFDKKIRQVGVEAEASLTSGNSQLASIIFSGVAKKRGGFLRPYARAGVGYAYQRYNTELLKGDFSRGYGSIAFQTGVGTNIGRVKVGVDYLAQKSGDSAVKGGIGFTF